jgi:flagellar assembly factor FliW
MNACGVLTPAPAPAADAIGPATGPQPIVTFEQGLIGFPAYRRFLLLPTPHPSVFRLQSLDEPALAFLVADPFPFFKGYGVDLPDTDTKRLGATAPDDVAIFVTVTLSSDPARLSTANLQGPIAVNVRTMQGRQVILIRSGYGVRESIDLRLAG